MTDNYASKPASEVKAGDIIYWASVRADVEVVSAGPPGFYGYTFDVRYKGEIEQARYKVGETVQVKRLERKSERQWWEESPEEFADGFTETEEVHTHHAEQFEAMYGPMPRFSEFKRGEKIRYRSGAGISTGEIVWVVAPQVIAGRQEPTQYVVENDAHGGFPDIIPQTDIIQ